LFFRLFWAIKQAQPLISVAKLVVVGVPKIYLDKGFCFARIVYTGH